MLFGEVFLLFTTEVFHGPPYYPSGLYDALREVFFRYQSAGLKKIYITETGLAKAPAKREPLQDAARIQFLKDHLVQAAA